LTCCGAKANICHPATESQSQVVAGPSGAAHEHHSTGTMRVIAVESSLNLDLEVVEIERKGRPGCGTSSSTNPRCTCMPAIDSED